MQQMNFKYKRTKVIATLGPAITGKIFTWQQFNDPKNVGIIEDAYNNMEKIIDAGVNIVRLNFSHGTHEEQEIRIKIARDCAQKLNRNVAVMLDTKGPEIRVGKFKTDDLYTINIGSIVKIFTKDRKLGDEKQFYVVDSTGTYNMAKDVKTDGMILIDDGKLQLQITKVDIAKGVIEAQALNTHAICENKRINLPDTKYTLPFLSKKDENDIKFAIKNNIEYIALSFVNSAENIKQIRKILKENNANENMQLIAKIESTEGIRNIDEIIAETNGVMVARGDLALEIPFFDIPYWEKYIIKKCRFIGKPVIIATQMLDSLERSLLPTRAEVTDVFFAVDRGADATMLSGETAKGAFPIRSVEVMSTIDYTAEQLFDYKRSLNVYFPNTNYPKYAKDIAIKIAKKVLPSEKDNRLIFPTDVVVVFSNDSEVIWAIASIRPAANIFVMTNDKNLRTKFAINYGIFVRYFESFTDLNNTFLEYAQTALKNIPYTNGLVLYKNKFYELPK